MSIRNTLFSLPLIALLILYAPYVVSSAGDEPPWPNTCGDGRADLILEDFNSPENITIYKVDPSILTLT
ncbi:MAG: hypothetical protein R2867_20250 [Caldilineaceae bacterium]